MNFRTLLEYITNKHVEKEWIYMVRGNMPLSSSILKEFEHEVEAYHVTSKNQSLNVIKLQNTKKNIAAFTKGSHGIASGALESAEVLFKLKGQSSFHADVDLKSRLDRNGVRWLDKYETLEINNRYTVPMFKILTAQYNLENHFELENLVSNMNGSEKQKFISFYYKSAKKILTSPVLNKIVAGLNKNLKNSYDHDELLIHDFKVLDVKIISDESSRKFDISQIKILQKQIGFKVSGIIRRDDISKIK